MTVTVTLDAPPEPYLTTRLLPSMARSVDGAEPRHRVVAMGQGFGGLGATKALKHAEVNVTDALVFLARISARGTSQAIKHASLCVQVIPTTTVVLTTVSLLITLYVAIIGERKRVAYQRGRRQAQTDSLYIAQRHREKMVIPAAYFV